MEFTKEELAMILDGLAHLPLARSYNLFQRLLAEHNKPELVPQAQLFEDSKTGT